MTKKSMKKFLRNPNSRPAAQVQWLRLYHKTLRVARIQIPASDPRLKLLEGSEKTPERALRKLSIISDADIQREFGSSE